MLIGTLAAIWRYPTKSLKGESLEAAEVTRAGLTGDRTAAFVVRAGHAREGKAYRGKEHEGLHLTEDTAAAARLGAERGVEVELLEG
jgi:uncharacterized protein YcbX